MLSFKKLWQGKYISVISPDKIPYECTHEDNVIMVLPIIPVKSKYVKGVTDYFVAIRKEFCPPYMIKSDNNDELFYTTITGMRDKENESVDETMKRELEEEAGIRLIDYRIVFKDTMNVCKSTDMKTTLYIIIVDTFEKVEASGDGTLNEKLSKTIFVNLKNMDEILDKDNIDFLLYGSYNILINKIQNFIDTKNII